MSTWAAAPLGSPVRKPTGSPVRSPSLLEGSPRSGSPYAILQDAKEFLASPQLPPRHRRPSLDPHKLPFDGIAGSSGWGCAASTDALPGMGMRLPSLTIEDFTAMKRREGNVASATRGTSRGDSRGKRRHPHNAIHGGIVSAPVSRGRDVSQLLTPMAPLDMPMTVPERGQIGHSPLLRAYSAVDLGGTTPIRSTSSSSLHRPPHPPKQRSVNSRDQARRSLEESSPWAMQAASPGSAIREETPSLLSLCQFSPSPMKKAQAASSAHTELCIPDLNLRPSALTELGSACLHSGRGTSPLRGVLQRSPSRGALVPRQLVQALTSAASSARGPKTGQFESRLLSDKAAGGIDGSGSFLPPGCHLSAPGGSSTATPSTRADGTLVDDDSAGQFGGSTCHSPCFLADASYGWDAGDSQPASCVGSIKGGGRGMLLSNLSCSHGPGGVTALSVSQCNLAAFKEEADSLEAVEETSEDLSWRRGEVIGHGSLGSVFTALNQSTGQIFAVKEVRIDARDKADLKFRESLENEIKLYKEMQHPRIVSYLGHGKVENNLYIYLEYMAGGSIRQVLSQFGAFDESLIATYTLDIVQGLDYLHTLDPPVLHRDVKGANILVGLESRVKLSDFGCSKRSKDTLAMSMRGSIPWMSPEVISQTGCGRRSDVWSLGCVVIEMATAKHPWGSFDNPLVAMRKIGMSTETPPLPKTVSDVCRAFMGVCTQRDKNLRPLAGALLEHEFIRDVQSPLG